MNTASFWALIDSTRERSSGDCERQAGLLREQLRRLPAEQILAFKEIFDQQRERAYTWSLWAAADLINGGCGDDGFEYFRWWLIAQGKEVFELALLNPDMLADYLDDFTGEVECEAILHTVLEAYQEKTGEAFPVTPPRQWPPAAPAGERCAQEDLPDLLPRLAARFG